MIARHILVPFHDFARGGTERIALTLAREWIEAGRKVTILCGSRTGGTRDLADPRIGVVELDPPIRRSLTSRLALAPAMARRLPALAPDVAFIPGNFHFGLGRAFRRACPTLPIVAKVSNPLLPALPRTVLPAASALLAAYVKPIDALVYMAPELAGDGRCALPHAPATVIAEPNLPRDHAPPPRSAPQDPPLVLAMARMEPQKDLALALHAFAELRRRRPARLLVLGDGAERPRLEALARRLGIAEDVAMPGFDPAPLAHLGQASALLLSSRFEGYPAAVVEALAADVPVVATDCTPALAGLIPTPLHGEVVPGRSAHHLADALERALALPFASGGLRPATVAHNGAAASAAAYLELFDRLAAGEPPAFSYTARTCHNA